MPGGHCAAGGVSALIARTCFVKFFSFLSIKSRDEFLISPTLNQFALAEKRYLARLDSFQYLLEDDLWKPARLLDRSWRDFDDLLRRAEFSGVLKGSVVSAAIAQYRQELLVGHAKILKPTHQWLKQSLASDCGTSLISKLIYWRRNKFLERIRRQLTHSACFRDHSQVLDAIAVCEDQAVLKKRAGVATKEVINFLPARLKGELFARLGVFPDAELARDWARGYYPLDETALSQARIKFRGGVVRVLNKYEHSFSVARFIRLISVAVGSLAVLFFVLASAGSKSSWGQMVNGLWDLVVMDLRGAVDREKETIFTKQFDDYAARYDASKVLQDNQEYLTALPTLRSFRYLTFAERVLPGFLFLVSTGSSTSTLNQKVLATAGLLNPNLAFILQAIVELYEQREFKESELRKHLLALRRHLVRRNVYPFIFWVMKGDTPALLLFAERVEAKMIMTARDFERLGLPVTTYPQGNQLMAQAIFVNGQKYPLKDAAGYFEGEFALVFLSLSRHPDWTAFHELGHVVDVLRQKQELRKIPENSELNALLFPVMFAPDNQDYVQNHLGRLLKSSEKNNVYVRAAWGVWRGLRKAISEEVGLSVAMSMADQVEPEKVDAELNLVHQLTSKQLSQLAFKVYRDPGRYLSSVPAGRSREGRFSGEELLYGTHASPEAGIVFSGLSLFTENSGGPKMIRDQQRGDGEGGVRPQALLEAVLAFVAVEIIILLVHWVARPVRRRYWFGKPVADLFSPADHNSGLYSGARTAPSYGWYLSRRWTQRDVGRLIIAESVPIQSAVRHQAHALLFFVPWLGPWLARCEWIFPAQKSFNDRERYHRKLLTFLLQKTDIRKSIRPFPEEKKGLTLASLLPVVTKRPVTQLLIKGSAGEISGDWRGDLLESLEPHLIRGADVVVTQKAAQQRLQELESMLKSQRSQSRSRKVWPTTTALSIKANASANRQSRGFDFDRFEKYTPEEDVRDIDWKATARSVDQEAIVRRSLAEDSGELGLLIDFRCVWNSAEPLAWLEGFQRAVQLIIRQKKLNFLISLWPGGSVGFTRVRGVLSYREEELQSRIFELLRTQSLPRRRISLLGEVAGFKFYSDAENESVQRKFLVMLNGLEQEVVLSQRLALSKGIVVSVGVGPPDHGVVQKLCGLTNKILWY